ncbi:hypothetical protein GC093_23625 [Paenibacillus sp. LMG 31456]|uniref:Uncharacterized protein n=1 Tax=Paenibacillus foliorum TaxID=2654974 RepID=A0A972GT00_9BACL|nr:hypothetical protein [Paenibacillus foliorum]NOU96192.1 hypothetical protein [Paenibacillus foliorum]
MDELIGVVENKINSLRASIEYNKKYVDYPFTNNCDHYYTILLLHNRLENWELFLKTLLSFRNSRCKPVSKKSDFFEKIMKLENESIPGFVTMRTQAQLLEYIKQLEWKVEELEGIWLKNENKQEDSHL